jgi:hypothetical protein
MNVRSYEHDQKGEMRLHPTASVATRGNDESTRRVWRNVTVLRQQRVEEDPAATA